MSSWPTDMTIIESSLLLLYSGPHPDAHRRPSFSLGHATTTMNTPNHLLRCDAKMIPPMLIILTNDNHYLKSTFKAYGRRFFFLFSS